MIHVKFWAGWHDCTHLTIPDRLSSWCLAAEEAIHLPGLATADLMRAPRAVPALNTSKVPSHGKLIGEMLPIIFPAESVFNTEEARVVLQPKQTPHLVEFSTF